MKINYGKWFYNQYKYLKGDRNGVVTFNDTKWESIVKRYNRLESLMSNLLNEQPYGVVGNKYGFDKLIDLISRSNYTFEDINDSLVDTYRVSLKNAMGRMSVNTEAVMFKCNNTDREHCSIDKFSHYYIIEAPMNQLHFGDRDEFIRQRLNKMHHTSDDYYMTLDEFVQSDISKILGFTIICTVNGFISNDCKIAVDDKGFKFKVGWLYSTDCEFIIYKLDESVVSHHTIDSKFITQNNVDGERYIPYDVLGNKVSMKDCVGKKCFVDIFDKNYVKTVPAVPNFGTFSEKGLMLPNIQQRTIDNINRNRSKAVDVIIYAFKHIHEVPNVYPAVNYYDILDSRLVYTKDEHLKVDSYDGKRVISTSTHNVNELETCTPPIVLDKPVNLSFSTILDCLSLYDDLIKFEKTFKDIGGVLATQKIPDNTVFINKIKEPIVEILPTLIKCYESYLKGATLTSLIDYPLIERFEKLVTSLTKLSNFYQAYMIDEFYADNYSSFVNDITRPFRDNKLSLFTDLKKLSYNYFTDENYTRFNRPVSEHCFISLKYNRDEECWLFNAPTIKHFKGIGNCFYIDSELKGSEIFKFFILYTDTESPAETDVDLFDMETVLDFDNFYNEVEKHMGYIKYWNTENKLLKISNIMYNKYDGETCVQVLSKILKRKIDGEDIIDYYPSDINYEPSNITSDGIDYETEYDERSPFAINFLFYTLSMLNNNKDQLQSYFFRRLSHDKYDNRYVDVNIAGMIDTSLTFPINYSQFVVAPLSTVPELTIYPDDKPHMFYGLPVVSSTSSQALSNSYRYVFNTYELNRKYPMLISNGLSEEYYTSYENDQSYVMNYNNDVIACEMFTMYLNYLYDHISDIQTNYKKSYNLNSDCSKTIKRMNDQIKKFNTFINNEPRTFMHNDALRLIQSVVNDNPFRTHMTKIQNKLKQINYIKHNGRSITNIEFFNTILTNLGYVYKTTGFDNYCDDRISNFYKHLKKINTQMNIYQYKKWINDFDDTLLSQLDKMMAKNENYALSPTLFTQFYDSFILYKNNVITYIDELYTYVNDEIDTVIIPSHVNPIINFCDDIINNYIFDLYIIDNIEIVNQSSSLYTNKPMYVECFIDMTNTDESFRKHFRVPVGDTILGNFRLYFQPVVDKKNNKNTLRSLSKICEYTFFDGSPLKNISMRVYDESFITPTNPQGTPIGTLICNITFKKISSTGDVSNTFNQIPNINTTVLDFENVHESFDLVNNKIISKNKMSMNYEMLVGNHFKQLEHNTELILNPVTYESDGPIDRIHLDNQMINQMVNRDYCNHKMKQVFFKPSQVFHIPINQDDKSITSVGGKYFVGQTLYLKSEDNIFVFPVKVTAVDHSISHGFVEAVVDDTKAPWVKIDDEETITKYLKTNITCSVIDDNMCNFLDEFSNSDYQYFSNASQNLNLDIHDETLVNAYSLPGDPIYVSNNTDYVYTRLNYFFNELVPNRFIDEEHKKHNFIYIGHGFIDDNNSSMTIKMINHDFNTLTNPELYPVLREEPNDHPIWDKEKEVFGSAIIESQKKINEYDESISNLKNQIINTSDNYEKSMLMIELDSLILKRDSESEHVEMLSGYIKQLEPPTKWYNVHAYEDALVYISNGRAKLHSSAYINNVRDIPFNDKLNVFIYDWEHKMWINPSSYNVSINKLDSVTLETFDDYEINNVLHSITITPNDETFVKSSKLLIYLSYQQSNIYDDIQINPTTCEVRFKPILSLDNKIDDYKPYELINVRKHFDGVEVYKYNGFNAPEDFSNSNAFYIKRPKRNGEFVYSPMMRMCDIKVKNNNNEYDYTNFDMFVRLPFKDVSTRETFKIPKYEFMPYVTPENFEEGVNVKLICVSNNGVSSFNGCVSTIMFNAQTKYVGAYGDTPAYIIKESSLPPNVTGKFVCTVLQDDAYKISGGLVSITISHTDESLIDNMNSWIKVPDEFCIYRELPNEFILVPKSNITLSENVETVISIKNEYIKTYNDEIDVNNTGLNPFEYYKDIEHDLRFPISDTRLNDNTRRLTIDTSLNKNVSLIKSTYVSVCRYSLQQIPKNGLIDFTGYIPTPLSYDRYEFWVNGRCLDKSNVIITSPTSVQLCGLKSLRNFELIEFVEDFNESAILPKSNVYIDSEGNTYSSYKLALQSFKNITKQNIRFILNTNTHQKIHDFTSNIIPDPSNDNIETDILDYIKSDESELKSYNQLYNIPSINGISIYHPKITSLGLTDIPNDKLVELFDKVWMLEATTNPLFKTTHKDGLNLINNEYLELHVKQPSGAFSNIPDIDDKYIIYTTGTTSKYFTLYVTEKSDTKIDELGKVYKIIPFIKTGVYVLLEKSFRGKWLQSTIENCKPILIK